MGPTSMCGMGGGTLAGAVLWGGMTGKGGGRLTCRVGCRQECVWAAGTGWRLLRSVVGRTGMGVQAGTRRGAV